MEDCKNNYCSKDNWETDDYNVIEESVILNLSEYIAHFLDRQTFMACCEACPNFGKSWGCPPFENNEENILSQYEKVRIFVTRIFPKIQYLAIDDAETFIETERQKLDKKLLNLEQQTGGRAMSYIGKCIYCEDVPCARLMGKSCRHPEKIRPSLEAYGFDIEKTLREIFNIELKWGEHGKAPEYFSIVTALLFV